MKTPAITPTSEEITARARQLWRIAGSPIGRDLEFWLSAKAELEHELQAVHEEALGLPRSERRAS
ncbi:MAG TPA: DUF2934 domain-containing protein [Opitutaceae bacterium]|nr:DUF2934 domain-containing protein [Opitutaceae bacterium]